MQFKPRNRILSALSIAELDLLLPYMQHVELKQHQVICDVGQEIKYTYFIEDGVASVLTLMHDGNSVECGMIGFEGMTPISMLLDHNISEQHTVIQLPGSALRISVEHCQAAFEKNDFIRNAILKFANSFLHLSAQTAACNRLHSVEKRLARWLLLSSDRFQSNFLPLTQEYLSIMLGVRRVGVTEAAGNLQRLGLIQYNNGQITVIDRTGLEKATCECYVVDKKRFNRPLA